MKHASLADVRATLFDPVLVSREYMTKMLQPVPDMPTIPDRGKYLIDKCAGKTVLDIGSSGEISDALRRVAQTYYAVDKVAGKDITVVDLDLAPDDLPKFDGVDIIVATEILEHLANPGWFLACLHDTYPQTPVYVSVPNAGAYRVHRGTHEMVNSDHVAYYSYTTLAGLLKRYKYEIDTARWYNGQPHKAEGILVLALPR